MLNKFRMHLIQTPFHTRFSVSSIGTISLSWSSGSSRSPQSFQKTSTRSGRLGRLMVSIASTTKDAGSSAMFLGQTLEFLHLSRKQAKHNDAFNRRANLGPCNVLFLSILRRREATRVPQGHIVDTWIFENWVSKNINSFYYLAI